ncbi:MAG: dTDP-4-dehydrorhamnose reductase [Bacteroidales bacterium]
MNILVTGANGQLGSELRTLGADKITAAGNCYIFTDIAELDITNKSAVREFIGNQKIELVINCAAYTNVEKAEEDVVTANMLNNEAAANLANACKEQGAFLIHISTDYVFGQSCGNLPLTENEPTNPLGVYGKTKLEGEESIKRITNDYLIFRTAWLYSQYGTNFVKIMRRLMAERESLNVVFDQVGTPTYAADLATVIFKIAEEKRYRHKADSHFTTVETVDHVKLVEFAGYCGIYHFSNEGVCSWYDFAVAIAELSGTRCKINPCHSAEFPSKVTRPAFSVLDKTKIKRDFGISIPHWRDSLIRCMDRL